MLAIRSYEIIASLHQFDTIEKIYSRVYCHGMVRMLNYFGTDGIRGKSGVGLFTQEKLLAIGNAIGRWFIAKYGTNGHILMARDPRISSHFINASLKSGLLQFPLVITDAGILPTPGVVHLMHKKNTFHLSIVISASHNYYEDNGIKIIEAQHGKLSLDDEQNISSLIQNTYQNYHPSYGTEIYKANAQEDYLRCVVNLFPDQFLAGKKIVLDTAHGATSTIAPDIFSALGAETITIHNQPNGYNINENSGTLHISSLVEHVLHHHADAGFAFDGDGDRVIAVSPHGDIKDGDDILALLCQHPAYQTAPTIVGTTMNNEGLVQHLSKQHKNFIRTAVGDKYIKEELEKNNLFLGGEPSGHIILRDVLPTGDGILTALKTLESITITGNRAMITFDHFPQIMQNVPVTIKPDLLQNPFDTIIQAARQLLTEGRIIVRYSGTEPVLRVMVEAKNGHEAHTTCSQLAQHLSKFL